MEDGTLTQRELVVLTDVKGLSTQRYPIRDTEPVRTPEWIV